MTTFLYPSSRQFPFDETCERIVRALEERKWKVPGIAVSFHNYGGFGESYRMVSCIEGEDFKLVFRRAQRCMGRWNDIAAVGEIIIPRQELHVYEDESGPTYIKYVGLHWGIDKKRFFADPKIHSKLRCERRSYLKYTGGCDCEVGRPSFSTFAGGDKPPVVEFRHTHGRRRSPLLVHDNNLGREYDPRGKEPWLYRTDEVFAEFTEWLTANVLAAILARPV